MSFFSQLFGHAAEANLAEVRKQYGRLLTENETIEGAYQVLRDLFIFTNKRLILVDRQGLTGKKVEYHSIPYRSITHFSIETAGHFDLEAEMKIWISGSPTPLQKTFSKSVDVYALQSALAAYVLR